MSELQTKTKSQLRAERRALQESQRAVKSLTKANVKNEAHMSENISQRCPLKQQPPILNYAPRESSLQPSKSMEIPHEIDLKYSLSKLDGEPILMKSFPSVPVRKQEPNRVHLFRHLKEPDKRMDVLSKFGLGSRSPIHPAFLALGVDIDEWRVSGANEMCLNFLAASEVLLRAQTESYTSGISQERSSFARHFGPVLQRHINFLNHCRSLPVTIRNAYQLMKQTLAQLDSVKDWDESRETFLSAIDEFRQNSIYLAGAEIAERASASIRPGECVCTFGYSSVVARVLERAWFGPEVAPTSRSVLAKSSLESASPVRQHNTNVVCARVPFSVLVVDASPRFEGRHMLTRLTKVGIPCEYTHIGALPSLAHKVSLAVVGCHALMNNGYVLACIGTAMMAHIVSAVSHAPTLVCAETYKFWEQAHSDAFEYNELGDPDDLWRGPRGTSADPKCGLVNSSSIHRAPLSVSVPDLSEWRNNPKLRLLHLTYDVLPPELVTAVVTEKGTLPTTSVPVVLRVKQAASTAF